MIEREALLKDLLLVTKDGEWGRGEPDDGLVDMSVIRGTDFSRVQVGDMGTVPTRYIPANIANRKRLRPNDILIETAGGSKDRPTGRTVFLKNRLFDIVERPMTCASFSRFLRVNPEHAHPEFVYWYLQYLYYSGQMEEHQVQHTGVARFQYTKFAEVTPIPLPSLSEQRAIAHILGTLDDKIELNRRMNETLEAMARAIFKSWFVDFDPVRAKAERRDPGLPKHITDFFPARFEDSELGEIPAGWRVEPIGEAVRVVGGGTPSTKEPAFWEGGMHYWATPKDLSKLQDPILLDTERKVTDAGLAKISSGLLLVGTVLLSSRAPVGYLAVARVPVSVNQGFIAMVCEGSLTNHYVLHWAVSNMEQIEGRASGTTFQEISKKSFRPMFALVPTSAVLSAFEAQVAPLYDKLTANLQESRTLAATRDALLPRLISGELRVGEAVEQTA